MAGNSIAQAEPVLAVIDIAMPRHEVLTTIPGRKRHQSSKYLARVLVRHKNRNFTGPRYLMRATTKKVLRELAMFVRPHHD